MAILIIIFIYIINFSYQYNLAGVNHLNIFLTSSIIIDLSIKKVKTLRKWNSELFKYYKDKINALEGKINELKGKW